MMALVHLFPLHPPAASTVAERVDLVFGIELLAAGFVVCLVAGLILFAAIRYRRRSPDDSPPRIGTHYGLEAFWTIATFLGFTGCFVLGAGLYVHMKKPPLTAERIDVVGKQWMWKLQHADGVSEINALHVPVGQPIELMMTSQDVIHDFFVPAFRIKQDVIPGSYTSQWFTATRPGTYRLFCSQYCGTDHSRMIGDVIVLTRADYDRWRAGLGQKATLVDAGRTVFNAYGCATCHGQVAPTLAGLYGSRVPLSDGSTVTADDAYVRRSILDPSAQIVAGFGPTMPTYLHQLTSEQVGALVAYVRSLTPTDAATRPAVPTPADTLQNQPPAQHRPDATPPFDRGPSR